MSPAISIKTVGLHAVEVAFSGVAWFVAVMWLNSVGLPPLGLTLVILTGMLVMFATLLLLATSIAIDDPRLRLLRVDSLIGIAISTIAKSNLGSVLHKSTLVSRLDHFGRCPASSSGEIQ